MPTNRLFPDSIRLLGHTFLIRDISLLKDKHSENKVTGYADWELQTIFIDFSRSDTEQLQTFFHELIHCIDHVMTNNDMFPNDKEERLIELLSSGLTAAMLDNRAFWGKVFRKIKIHSQN